VGDGPSGVAFDGSSLWLVSHRDNSLDRIEPGSNSITHVASAISPVDTTAASASRRSAARSGSRAAGWISCSSRRPGQSSVEPRSVRPAWT